jgi:hypothetical protein
MLSSRMPTGLSLGRIRESFGRLSRSIARMLQNRKDALLEQGRGKRRSIPTVPGLFDRRTSKRDTVRVGFPDRAGCSPACAEGTQKRKKGALIRSVAVQLHRGGSRRADGLRLRFCRRVTYKALAGGCRFGERSAARIVASAWRMKQPGR